MSEQKKIIRVALDAMGGDFSPSNEIEGGIAALRHFSGKPFELIFVGKEKEIKSALAKHDTSGLNYSIVHADEIVTMYDEPSTILRKKRNSSLYQGILLQKDGLVDAFVSAGNTGAVMSTATLTLGRIQGVSRPTIGAFFPAMKSQPVLVVDVGANVDSKPKQLYEFSVMGSIYARQILNIENPKVGLLNVGEEETKGNEIALQTHELLSNSSLNFIGNVEGRDILQGTADVIICDGFTGNIVLKFAESMITFLKSRFKVFASESLLKKIAMALMMPALRKIMNDMDYQKYGGVPLLGVNGVVIIGHGKSSPLAIKNMILLAQEMINKDVNKRIENALNPPSPSERTIA